MAVSEFAEPAGVSPEMFGKDCGVAHTLCLKKHNRGSLELLAETGELVFEAGDFLAEIRDFIL
jgi:hypothetical protein